MRYLWLKVKYWVVLNCWEGHSAEKNDMLEDIQHELGMMK